MKPRDYQIEADASIYRYFQSHTGNPLIGMPTGTGKSVVIAYFLQGVYRQFPTERVMMLTHVKELIEQNFLKLLEAWPTAPAGVYSAGLGRRDTMQKIIFAGIASVAKRAAEFGKVSLVIIDEAHLVGPNDETMYLTFLAELRKVNPFLKVIGLSATLWRLGHGRLHENHPIFTDVCFDMTTMQAFNWLIAQGYLCTLIPRETKAKLDTTGLPVRAGEFSLSELQHAVDKYEVTQAALIEAVKLAGNRWSWLVFCSGVDHSEHVAEQLTALGIECKAIHSKVAKADRDKWIKDWKAGRLRALANNNVLTTGIDHPPLQVIVVLRPTMSTVLWVQMLGRGTRPYYAPGYNLDTQEGRLAAIAASHKQDCLVLDFAGNTRRLGPINDPVIPKKKGEKAGDAPIKLCPQCATYNHASARHCIFCGFEFPTHGPKVHAQASTDALIKSEELRVPTTHVFPVEHVTYKQHNKPGKPPSMRVTYYSGVRQFSEFVMFEHMDGMSRSRARRWWRERTPGPEAPEAPDTVARALDLVEHLKAPTHIRVWVDKQYPSILAVCFDGSAFGELPKGTIEPPTTDSEGGRPPMPPPKPRGSTNSQADWDDDIPF